MRQAYLTAMLICATMPDVRTLSSQFIDGRIKSSCKGLQGRELGNLFAVIQNVKQSLALQAGILSQIRICPPALALVFKYSIPEAVEG